MARTSHSHKVAPNGHTESSQKLEAVNIAMEQIEKQYGRGSIMRFGEVGFLVQYQWWVFAVALLLMLTSLYFVSRKVNGVYIVYG